MSQSSESPLSLICCNCQKLFACVNEPLTTSEGNNSKRVTFDEHSYAVSSGYCHVCATLKRRSASRSWAPDLLLVYEPDGVDIFILKSNEVDAEGVRYQSQAIEFFASVEGGDESSIELDPHAHTLGQPSVTVNPQSSPTHTGDHACFDLIRDWLHICTSKHELCRRAQGNTSTRQPPTRLINMRNGLRLIETATSDVGGEPLKYATLSHRWMEGTTKLVQSSLHSMKQCIDPACLSLVFQESIAAAMRLEIEYIWIDALCIVQDDPEDWSRESSSMGAIYQNAFLNIGASAAALTNDPREIWRIPGAALSMKSPIGLFVSRDATALSMIHVEVARQNYARKFFGFTRAVKTDRHSYGPLMERGWILQERLLSPRSVYFGEQLTWECPELLANEVFPRGSPSKRLINPWNLNSPLRLVTLLERQRLEHIEYANGLNINDAYRTWLYLVENYRHCKLTFQTDALPALSGLASSFQDVLKDHYLAGLWRQDLIRGLLWNRCLRHCRGKIAARRPTQYRGKSKL